MYLVEVEGLGPNGIETFRWTSVQGGYISSDGLVYEGRVNQAGNYERYLFRRGSTLGRSQVGYGEVVIDNTDGVLDYLLNYAFDSRNIRITLQDGTIIFVGTIAGYEMNRNDIIFRLRDRQQVISDLLVVSATYAGNNSLPNGLEGVAGDWKAQTKPQPYGKVRLASLPFVNTSRLILQVAHRAPQTITIDAVQDSGANITASSNYSSISDMETNAPSAGQFRFYPGTAGEGAYVRLGSSPTRGNMTADITEGATSADRTVAGIMRRICLAVGLPASDIQGVTDVDSNAGWLAGYWVAPGTSTKVGDALDALAASVHGYWIGQRDGSIRFGLFRAPDLDPIKAEIEEWQILEEGTNIARVVADNEGLPVWRVTINYQRNWFVQTRDQLAGVALANSEQLSNEYRKVVVESAAAKTRNPLAGEIEINTLLETEADATSLANTLLSMYSVQRDVFEIGLSPEYSRGLELGDVINLTASRFGLQNGRRFRVIGITEDLQRDFSTITIWG